MFENISVLLTFHFSLILLHEKGERVEIKNSPSAYRLMLGKFIRRLSKIRIYNILDAQQPAERAGFLKSYSTMDHIHTLNQLIEKAREYPIDITLMFIDFNEAFDSLYHNNI